VGRDILDKIKRDDSVESFCDKNITQTLLNFNQYVSVKKECFLEWENPLVCELNDRFQENVYLKLADEVKKGHEVIESDWFAAILTDLLLFKVKGDMKKVEAVVKICKRLVAEEWLKEGLLKSLKTSK
jgi:hypothetical protein